MKDRWEEVLKVEEALVHHHRSSGAGEVPPFLARQAMMRIREEFEQRQAIRPDGARVRGLVWRFAMVTCLVAVLLGAFGVRSNDQTQVQLAEFMLDDASGLEWVQDFGVL